MSIFVARPRTVKPTRVAPAPLLPFGLGLEGLTVITAAAVKGDATRGVAVTSHADYRSQADPAEQFPYHVREYRDGQPHFRKGYYLLSHAQGHAAILATPLVEEAKPARKAARFEPSKEDRDWWAQYTELAANGIAPVSGGAPRPEPVCGLSGAWFMPGEIADGEDEGEDDFSWRVANLLPDPEPELSDDFNGAFGMGAVE